MAAYREEKLRCEEAGETFFIGHACTKIATDEVNAEVIAEMNADTRLRAPTHKELEKRIKGRAEWIYDQLHEKCPNEVKKQ